MTISPSPAAPSPAARAPARQRPARQRLAAPRAFRIGAYALFALLLTAVTSVTIAAAARAETEAREIESPRGINIWLVEDHTVPIVSIQAAFRGAGRLDTAETAGLSSFTASLFDEGAGDYDAQAFQQRLRDLNASLGFSVGTDNFYVSMTALTGTAADAADMLRLALLSPRFDGDAVERLRNQTLVALAQRADNPNAIAGETWAARAFPDSPYGLPNLGSVETVNRFSVSQVKKRARALRARGELLVVAVGALSAEEAGRLVDAAFADLPTGEVRPAKKTEIAAAPGTEVVRRDDFPQSVVVFGAPGIYRDDPDFMAAYVDNYILGGGGFASRLMEEVRAKRGLAYGVYSYLDPNDGAALFSGGVATRNEQVAESLQVIRDEIARMGAEGPTEQELADAKTYLTGSWALNFDSTSKIAQLLLGFRVQGLGLDYVKNRNALVEAVTLDDARRVAKRLFDADKLRVVVVGAPDGL